MKKVLSMLLTMLMLLSVMCVAPISTSAAEVEVAQTGANVTSDGTSRLYFNMKAVSWWTAGTHGNGNFAYFFNNSTGKNAWSAHAVKYSGDTYYVVVPAGTWGGVILTRNNTSTDPNWNNKWNQTGDITLSSTSNYISNFSEGSTSVTWGTAIKPASTAAVTASATSVETGTAVTLTTALTSNADINKLSTVTYSVSPETATVTDGTFVAAEAGEYTVTATATYAPGGYATLTSTTTATVAITVTAPVVEEPATEAPTEAPVEPPVEPELPSEEETEAPTETPAVPEAPTTKTIYFTNSEWWTGTIYAYYWFDPATDVATPQWPGEQMKYVETNDMYQDIYKITVPADIDNIIFNNNASQTVDISLADITEGTGFYLTNQVEGKWNVATYTYAPAVPEVPEVTETPSEEPSVKPEVPSDEENTDAPAEPEVRETKTFYFTNNKFWDGTIYAYYWYNDGTTYPDWPGVEMTYVEKNDMNEDIYKVTVPADIHNIIFNGNGDDDRKTPDIYAPEYPDCTGFYRTDERPFYGTYTYVAPEVPEIPEIPDNPVVSPDEPAQTYTVYFVNYANSFNDVYAYAWTSIDADNADMAAEWPGVKMTPTGEALSENTEQAGGLVYSVTFDKEYENIIFSNGANYEELQKTADLEFMTGKYCYWGNECWYDSIADIEAEFPVGGEVAQIPVYFQNNWFWSDVRIHFWDSSIGSTEYRGITMDYYDNDGLYDYYVAMIPVDAKGFLISGIKNDGSNAVDQTPDITEGFYDGICYYMRWDSGNAVGFEDISVMLPDDGGNEGGDNEGGEDIGGTEPEPQETTAKFAGYSARLEGNIAFKLFFDITDDVMADPDAKLVVTTIYGTEEIALDELNYESGISYYYIATVSAKDMTTVINVQIITSVIETESYDTSVQAYLTGLISKPEVFVAQQDIAKALLNYGAAAQLYFDCNTDNLANSVLSEEDRTVATADLSAYAPVIEGANDGNIKYVGAALVLKSETTLKFYFTVEDAGEYENIGISVDGLTAVIEPNGSYYEFAIRNNLVQDLDEVHVLNTGSATITYSALSYAYLAQQSTNVNLVKLANALAAYHTAGQAYAEMFG